jgi:hypothetical protein
MEVEITNINSEEFRQDLTKALAKSAIGDAIMSIVEKSASDYQVKNMIKEVVLNHIRQKVVSLLQADTNTQSKIEARAKELINDSLIESLIGKVQIKAPDY